MEIGDNSESLWEVIIKKYGLPSNGWRIPSVTRWISGFWRGLCSISAFSRRILDIECILGLPSPFGKIDGPASLLWL